MRRVGLLFAALAGSCAAMASVFGKLAMDSSIAQTTWRPLAGWSLTNLNTTTSSFSLDDNAILFSVLDHSISLLDGFVIALRLLCFGLFFLSNLLMWNMFVKSLNNTSSSLVPTVINTATNFFLSAVLAWLLFDESLSWTWAFGASFILVGLVLISRSTTEEVEEKQSTAKATQSKKPPTPAISKSKYNKVD
ncbi:hypothetical protein QOT17_005430 [Balamuthia mandrillaris]